MDLNQNESQHDLDSSEAEMHEDAAEGRADYELLTIQVDEDLCNFNELPEETSDDEMSEAQNMVDAYAEQEIIDKLLTESISVAEATKILIQELSSEEEELPDETQNAVPGLRSYRQHEKQGRHKTGRRRRRRGKRRRQMPPAMAGLMGEANLKLANGHSAEAEKMCLELIRRYPLSPQPFETLAMIYEERNMPMKAVKYWLTAAYLSSNPDTWEKMANIFENQLNDPDLAVFCYTRAIKADPTNIDLHWSRAKLLEFLGECSRAVNCYKDMLNFLKPDQQVLGVELAVEIAKMHHASDSIAKAQETLETALEKYDPSVTADAANLLLEVLLQQNNYSRCLEILIKHGSISLGCETVSKEEYVQQPLVEQVHFATLCTDRENMPVDLMAKFSIALINLKKYGIAQSVVDDIKKESVLEFGDLFLEISEAYYENEKFDESISLLEQLLTCDKFNLAAVWLHYAESLSSAKKLEEAAEAYGNVIKLAPQHSGTRVCMSNILKTLGRHAEALSVLNQCDNAGPIDSTVLYKKCQMLQEHNETEKFVSTAKQLMERHFLNLRSKEEVEAMINIKKLKNKRDAIKELRESRGDLTEPSREYVGERVPVKEQWQIFLDLCEILFNEGRMEELEWLSFNALGSTEFMKNRELAREVEFICLTACIHSESFYFAYNIVRDIVTKHPDCVRAWNILCYVISKTDDIRHNRFLLRLTYKHYDSLPLSILNGHNCVAAGTYKLAMAEYTQVFKQDPKDPLVSLMLGLTYIHMACQKFSGNKHDLTIKGAALLQTYLETRGECQESYYNLGRAMHQLNILPQTIHYYKKALELPPPIEDSEGNFDLSREIAFNLSLVYKRSGSTNLIRYYLCKYINV